jgi:hypothetical protein
VTNGSLHAIVLLRVHGSARNVLCLNAVHGQQRTSVFRGACSFNNRTEVLPYVSS